MDSDVADIKATVARIETTLEELKEVSVYRLNDHAGRVDSLERTRDRQKGAARVVAVLSGGLGVALAYFKFWE